MTILNVNDIKEFKEQPTVYHNSYILMSWLCYDLNKQRENIANELGIKPDEVDENSLTLNIGCKNKINKKVIDVEFYFDISIITNFFYNSKREINYKCNFQYIRFKENVSIQSIIFNEEIYFSNINSSGDFYFRNNEFKNNCYFDDIILNKNSYFNGCIFYKQININPFYLNCIDFSNLKPKYGLYISCLTKIHKLYFNNVNINTKIDFYNIEVEEADFKGSVINGGLINPVNFKVHKFANRESALFLKNEAYARNNAIDALQYKAKEIECHKDDLMKSSKDIIQNKEYSFNKKIKKLYKIVGDIASIYLSSFYSDNGQNWVKALLMTIFITIICFNVFYIPDLTQSNIMVFYYKNWFSELIKYFIPTDYSLIIKYAASKLNLFLKIFGVLVYFLGKILFWYGSVQTVQAFRKFAKGA